MLYRYNALEKNDREEGAKRSRKSDLVQASRCESTTSLLIQRIKGKHRDSDGAPLDLALYALPFETLSLAWKSRASIAK